MKTRSRKEGRLLAVFCILWMSSSAGAQQPTATSLAKIVDAHYNHLQSLRARFTERYQGMGIDRRESGTLTLRKPGRMRWDYDTPRGKLFLLDGHDAYSYTPGDVQAQRLPTKRLDDLRSPLQFLLGHASIEKELDKLTLSSTSGEFILAGVPKGMSQRVRSLAVVVDASGIIHSLRLEETDGAVTSFEFSDIQENIPTRNADFVFTPPPGVSIANGPPPI